MDVRETSERIKAGRQPVTSTLVTVLNAPAVGMSSQGGSIFPGEAQGLYVGDLRLVSAWELKVAGAIMEAAGNGLSSASQAAFQSVIRGIGDPEPHATVWVTVDRHAERDRFVDTIVVHNGGRETVRVPLELFVASDLASLARLREGDQFVPVEAEPLGRRSLLWRAREASVLAEVDLLPVRVSAHGFAWSIELPAGQSQTIVATVRPAESTRPVAVPHGTLPITVTYTDPSWQRFTDRSISDLAALRTREGESEYIAAGAPWYLALFGRDSIWTARMCLPFDLDLAVSTLQALALHQGQVVDAATSEEPGKVLHEVRTGAGHGLPPTYYGAADATALWILLFEEAYDAGADEAKLRLLLPALERALGWVVSRIERDGFVYYDKIPGLGEIHQSWKDSTDSVFDSRGVGSPFPLALCEVQGYAYAAARAGDRLLRLFGAGGSERAVAAAAALQRSFADRFWVTDSPLGVFPALALDGAGGQADILTSNIGHLLGTRILDAAGEARVAELLMSDELLADTGVRTLARSSIRYSPIAYHNGSVWPHDTGIVILGLTRAGFRDEAVELADRLVRASRHFDGQLPELWGGEPLPGTDRPLSYPTACRPQAWSAASALACLRAVASPVVDRETRQWSISPSTRATAGAVSVSIHRPGEPGRRLSA